MNRYVVLLALAIYSAFLYGCIQLLVYVTSDHLLDTLALIDCRSLQSCMYHIVGAIAVATGIAFLIFGAGMPLVVIQFFIEERCRKLDIFRFHKVAYYAIIPVVFWLAVWLVFGNPAKPLLYSLISIVIYYCLRRISEIFNEKVLQPSK